MRILTSLIITFAIACAAARAENATSTSASTPQISQDNLESIAKRYTEQVNESGSLFTLFGNTRDQLRKHFSEYTTSTSTAHWNAEGTEYSISSHAQPGIPPLGIYHDSYKFTFDKDGQVDAIKVSSSGCEGRSESTYTSREQIIKEKLEKLTQLIEILQSTSNPISKALVLNAEQKNTARVHLYAKRGAYYLLLGDKKAGLNDISTSERLRNDYGMKPIEQLLDF